MNRRHLFQLLAGAAVAPMLPTPWAAAGVDYACGDIRDWLMPHEIELVTEKEMWFAQDVAGSWRRIGVGDPLDGVVGLLSSASWGVADDYARAT